MNDNNDIGPLTKWYRELAQPFLLKHQSEKVPEFDKDLNDIRLVADAVSKPTAVCFLGVAGIGKSTLINALVGGQEVIVPAGGMAPLPLRLSRSGIMKSRISKWLSPTWESLATHLRT